MEWNGSANWHSHGLTLRQIEWRSANEEEKKKKPLAIRIKIMQSRDSNILIFVREEQTFRGTEEEWAFDPRVPSPLRGLVFVFGLSFGCDRMNRLHPCSCESRAKLLVFSRLSSLLIGPRTPRKRHQKPVNLCRKGNLCYHNCTFSKFHCRVIE